MPFARAVGIAAVYLLAYWGLDWISFIFPAKQLNITPWNPPPAATVVLAFLCGWRWAPMFFLAAFTSNLIARYAPTPIMPTVIADVAEAVIYGSAAVALRRLGLRADLRTFRDVMLFIGVTSLAAALMAISYICTFWAFGYLEPGELVSLIFEYWVGDMIGVTVVAPAFLVHRRHLLSWEWIASALSWEHLAQLGAVALATWIMFFWQDPVVGPLFYPLFIPLVWVAARQGLPGTTLLLLLMQVGLMGTVEVFGISELVTTKLQYLMLALSWTGLLLGAVISERERAREATQLSEARLKSIVEMAPDGILITDDRGDIEMANRGVEDIFGTTQSAIVGRSIGGVLPIAPGDKETVIRRPDGREVTVEAQAATVPIGGRTTSVIAVRDVTARKETEARVRQHRDTVEQAFRGRLTEGLAGALAHELNQPLSAIVTYTGAAQRILATVANVPARALEQLTKAAAQATRAGDIIRRLREFFQGATLEQAPLAISEPIRDMLGLLRDEIERSGTKVEVHVPSTLVASADRLQIEQVLMNLLRNSIEALAETPRGRRRIVVSAAETPEGMVEVKIADTGRGIDPEVAERLFDPFVTTSATGLGLGLTICRSMIEAHGGKLWADRVTSEGAVLHFTLPTTASAATERLDKAYG
ncbi:MAG TPA: ATP-binding protein [Alphaproteobacteria bacterium]|nr:ATP-binding protein [Alphaproteobacteria bacterium]